MNQNQATHAHTLAKTALQKYNRVAIAIIISNISNFFNCLFLG